MIAELFALHRRHKRSIQNPAIPLTADNILDYLGGNAETDSGVKISARSALTYAPVWQAVSMISGDIAKLPLQKKLRQGLQTIVDERHRTHVLVAARPNDRMHAFKFWRRTMVHLLIWNHAYSWIRFGSSGATELIPLLPDRTKWDDNNDLFVTEVDGKVYGLFPSEVLHFENFSIDGKGDCQLISKARHSWALGLAAQKFSSVYFKQGSQSGGILEIPTTMTKKAADNLVEGIYKRTGETNWFKAMVLRDGAKFHQTTINAEESQLNELRETQVRDVARWFNLQPSRLGLSDSQSYNSKYEDNKSYLSTTLSPHLCTIRSECWMKLLTDEEQRQGTHSYKHDTSELLDLDPETAANIGRTEIDMGAISPNEYLISRGRNPRPGGDFYITPLNMRVTDPQGQPLDDEAADPGIQSTEGANPNADPNAALNAAPMQEPIRAAAAARTLANHLRKEVKRKDAGRFVGWVDSQFEALLNECFTGVAPRYADPCRSHWPAKLRHVLETATEETLKEAIHQLATEIEQWNVEPSIAK